MASVTEQVKESVKESLVGHEEPQHGHPPSQIRSEFEKHAVKDEESGEYFLGQKEFVDAIAPEDEDYVSLTFFL